VPGWLTRHTRTSYALLSVTMKRFLVLGASIALVRLAVAGCDSSSKASGLKGFGATEAVWDAHHTKALGTVGCDLPFSCYGPIVDTTHGKRPQFTSVQKAGGRVSGFLYLMASDTSEAMAKQEVLALLPADTRSTGSGALLHSTEDPDDTCLAWNLQSATIAHALEIKILAVTCRPVEISPEL
jgi:hypothetical protein